MPKDDEEGKRSNIKIAPMRWMKAAAAVLQ